MPRFQKLAALAAVVGAAASAQAQQLSPQEAMLARNLAATCANCHGTNGVARGDMKPLAGVSAGKITAMLADFKSGAQPATIMHQIAKGYTDDQIRLIAGYYAALPAAK
ncbi:MAG: cytochrome C [Rubrivivax sp.]|nr:cytochrome C [Rubrivivax sp.]